MGNQYRKPKSSETIQLHQKLEVVHKAAKFIKEEFIGNEVTFYSKNYTLPVHIIQANYMHLCGVDYGRGAKSFFSDALENRIDLDLIKIKKDGTTFTKLDVLSVLPQLLSESVQLIKGGIRLTHEYDAALRTNKRLLALELKNKGRIYFALSLLNLRKFEIGNGEPVIKIEKTSLSTGEVTVVLNTYQSSK
jgi:hypothetical protein